MNISHHTTVHDKTGLRTDGADESQNDGQISRFQDSMFAPTNHRSYTNHEYTNAERLRD
jgi:hypothetical protein